MAIVVVVVVAVGTAISPRQGHVHRTGTPLGETGQRKFAGLGYKIAPPTDKAKKAKAIPSRDSGWRCSRSALASRLR